MPLTKATPSVLHSSVDTHIQNLGVDSAEVTNLVDSDYVKARADSDYVKSIIDSDYVSARASSFDSNNAIGLIDSSYVQARQVDLQRDSAYIKTVQYLDDEKLYFGTGQDLKIYSDGSNSLIWGEGTSYLRGTSVNIAPKVGAGYVDAVVAGSTNVSIKHPATNAIKLQTSSTGVSVTGTADVDALTTSGVAVTASGVHLDDNKKLVFGTDSDVTIEYDPNSFRINAGSWNAQYQAGNHYFRNNTGSVNAMIIDPAGAITMKYNNSTKLQTASTGINVTGSVNADSATIPILSGNITMDGVLRGPSTFYIDPAPVDSDGGTLVIRGNLQVDGTETIVNSQTVTINDKTLLLGDSATTPSLADGASVQFGDYDSAATITYDATQDRMQFDKGIELVSKPLVVGTGSTDVGRLENSSGVLSLTAYTGRQIAFGNDTNGEHVRIDADGNVGIGDTSPDHRLHVYHPTTNVVAKFESGDDEAWIALTDSSGDAYGTLIGRKRSNNTLFKVADEGVNEKFAIQSNGYIKAEDTSQVRLKLGSTGSVDDNTGNWIRGTGSQLGFNTAGGDYHWEVTGTERMRLTSGGKLVLGDNSSTSVGGLQLPIQVQGTDAASSGLAVVRNAPSSNPSYIVLAKTRSTSVGGNTLVQNNDRIGSLRWAGGDGTDVNSVAAEIYSEVDGTAATDDMPGRLVLATTADGNAGTTPRLTIKQDGDVGIGTQAPAQKLEVNGNILADGYFGDGGATSNITFSQATSTSNPSVALWGRDHGTYPGQVHIVARSSNASANSGKISFWDYTGSAFNRNMTITKDGDVGIGTDDPLKKLHVTGTILGGDADGTGGSLLLAQRYGSGDDLISTIGTMYSSGGLLLSYGMKPKNGSDGKVSSFDNFSGKRAAIEMTNTKIAILKAPAQQTTVGNDVTGITTPFYFDLDNGRMGIGTTSPSVPLQIRRVETITGHYTLLDLFRDDSAGDLAGNGDDGSFIDFTFKDGNTNSVPQLSIGAEVGNRGEADAGLTSEGRGAFVVKTNDGADSLTEKFRVSWDGYIQAQGAVTNTSFFKSSTSTSISTTSETTIAACSTSVTAQGINSNFLYHVVISSETDVTASNKNGFFMPQYKIGSGSWVDPNIAINMSGVSDAAGGTANNVVTWGFDPGSVAKGTVVYFRVLFKKSDAANVTFNQQSLASQPTGTSNYCSGFVQEIGS